MYPQTAQGNRHTKTAEVILQLAPVARPKEATDEAKATDGADAAAEATGQDGGDAGANGKEPADPKFLPIEVHKAAASGKVEAVQQFLDGGGDISARCVTTKDPTIVLAAAARGHLPVVQLALKHGCELESTDCLGHTPLMSAAQGGHVGVMMLLLKASANVDAQDATRNSPLMLAARHNQLLAARALVRAGANVSHRTGHNTHARPLIFKSSRSQPPLLVRGRIATCPQSLATPSPPAEQNDGMRARRSTRPTSGLTRRSRSPRATASTSWPR